MKTLTEDSKYVIEEQNLNNFFYVSNLHFLLHFTLNPCLEWNMEFVVKN